jgi:phosphotransferase system  glucose/maltose/N-acetylglucosamine-specific IIC component
MRDNMKLRLIGKKGDEISTSKSLILTLVTLAVVLVILIIVFWPDIQLILSNILSYIGFG